MGAIMKKLPPISEEISALRHEVAAARRDVRAVGEAVKTVHGNTIPAVGWIPSIAVAALLVYPVQALVKDTAKDYHFSAVVAGLLEDASIATKQWAFNSGIEAAGGSTAYSSPLDRKLEITSGFGMRIHPVTGIRTMHNGTDYRCDVGDTVRAIRNGIVAFAGDKDANGNLVVITHSDGSASAYAHLDSIDVSFGQAVSTTEQIGECGSTGRSTGPHLHLGLKDSAGNMIDPATVVDVASVEGMWAYFRSAVAQSESAGHGGYTADNGSYKGKYQMGETAMKDIGMWPVNWEQFKHSPETQERAYQLWQRKNIAEGRNQGVIRNDMPAYKLAGFLHAAQFGATNASEWYAKGVEFHDGNAMPISEYARRGEAAFISKYGRFAPATQLLNAIEGGNAGQDIQDAALRGES